MNQTQSPRHKIVVAALLSGLLIAAWLILASREKGGQAPTIRDEAAAKRLQLHRVALASMESLQPAEAADAWEQLFNETQDDTSVAINRALNLTIAVDTQAEIAANGSASDDEKKAARQVLPDAIAKARQAVTDYANADGDSMIATWLTSRINLREASLLPRSLTKSIRNEVFVELTQKIDGLPEPSDSSQSANTAKTILLAGPLIEVIDLLEDPIDGIPQNLLGPAATAIAKLSKLRDENLYLAVRGAKLALAAEQPVATELIERTRDLSRSIQPTLQRQTKSLGKTPDELVDEIVASVKNNDFQSAENQMLLWFNLLNSTELIKTDRRRVSPHPLDLMSFRSMRVAAQKVADSEPVKPIDKTISFKAQTTAIESPSDQRVLAMISLDANLDFAPDIVTLHTGSQSGTTELTLWMHREKSFEKLASQPLDSDFDSLLVADWFMVDSSAPGRLRASVSSGQHNTLQSVLVYGKAGVQMIAIDGRETASSAITVADVTTGLESLRNVTAMTTGDLEGDGDLDLIASDEEGWNVMVNRGNRTFFAVPDSVLPNQPWAAGDAPTQLAIADLDRDLDLDILSVHSTSGTVGRLENLLHLQFRFDQIDDVEIPGVQAISIQDVDGNVSWDLVLGSPEQLLVIHSQTAEAGQWVVEESQSIPWPTQAGNPTRKDDLGKMVVADFDNDSLLEALWTTPNSAPTEIQAIQLGGPSLQAQPLQFTPPNATQWFFAQDFNNDRHTDLAGVSVDKGQTSLVTAINQSKDDSAKSLAIRFKGIDDNNANSGRVNHYAIGSVLELRFGPHYRSQIITEPVTRFGLDGVDGPINLRVVFPNGLTQTIKGVSAGVLIEEEQTLKGSCPYLYAFDGQKFQFVTDCLWAAPLGLQVQPGVVVPDRPWEHLKIDGRFLSPVDGAYELRITEELWEVAYFDKLALSRVSHPADVEVFTNEKVGPGFIAEPKIHAFHKDDVYTVPVRDTDGNDVTELLTLADGKHVQAFDIRLRQGLCEPHWIELDLNELTGSITESSEVKLILNGWILPTDTSLNIQIAQNPELPAPSPPSLWVPVDSSAKDAPTTTADTQWEVADPYIGFPGGKNKTIVVDVTQHLRAADPRLRIKTSSQIYWDRASVCVRSTERAAETDASIDVEPLELLSAEVAEHGFSRRIKPGPRRAETYDYADTTISPRWPPLSGELTALGPVKDLLTRWDDAMVVISGGDEIRLRFADANNPLEPNAIEPRSRSLRYDFILHGVGWDKDADLNTLAGQSTMPLPSRSMKSYPPHADDLGNSQSTFRLNSNHLQRRQLFGQFWKTSF